MNYMNVYKNWRLEKKALRDYGYFYKKMEVVLKEILHYYTTEKKYNVAIWGGGLKGIAFLKIIDSKNAYIHYVFDIDKNKFNTKLSTGHKIVNYKDPKFQDVDVVCIMNNNYETEIAGLLKDENMRIILVNIDSIIFGNLSTKEALQMYNGDENND